MVDIILIVAYSIAIILCIIFSGFFSGSEMSYSSCNRTRLDNLSEDGDKRAKEAAKIVARFDDTLSTILIGNNLVNIACSSIGTVLVISVYQLAYPAAQSEDAPTWLSTLVLTILIIIFGETIPKISAKKQANKKALKYAYVIRNLNVILKPIVVPVVALVRLCTKAFKGEKADEDDDVAIDELSDIIETAEEEKVLDEDASELVQAAIDFSDTPVYEVMTARVDMLAIDIEDDKESIDEIIANSTYTRIPVYEGSIDNIIGTLSLNRYLRACLDGKEPDIRSLIMPPKYVYKTTKLPNVLNELKHAKQHLAVVTDEYGGTLGIVSMEDVLEAIVGDIWDESDEVEDEVVETPDGRFEFDGDTAIDSFLETLDMSEGSLECVSDTVGGWTIETLEHFPERGESFEWKDYRITVMDSDDHRVSKVMAEKINKEE
ncbi:MAG: HlyC/CorC family transporter [Lachnospiraceae bacterium]|nr:HlyC/CorC family transporter [Lachnospiraceae bacterium]